MAVRLVKLTTGEEFAADVSEKDGKLVCKSAMKFVFSHEGVGMMPFLPLSKEDKFEIDVSLVMLKVELEDEVLNAYNVRHGSGLVLPPSGLRISE